MDSTQVLESTQVLGSQSQNYVAERTDIPVKVATLTIDGVDHPIWNKENTIGRDGKCDIVLNNNAVSVEHAVIEADLHGSHFICDLGSTNKTKMGQVQLKPRMKYFIIDGALLRIANVRGVYRHCNFSIEKVADQSSLPPIPDVTEIPGTPERREDEEAVASIITETPSKDKEFNDADGSDGDIFGETSDSSAIFLRPLNSKLNETKSPEKKERDDCDKTDGPAPERCNVDDKEPPIYQVASQSLLDERSTVEMQGGMAIDESSICEADSSDLVAGSQPLFTPEKENFNHFGIVPPEAVPGYACTLSKFEKDEKESDQWENIDDSINEISNRMDTIDTLVENSSLQVSFTPPKRNSQVVKAETNYRPAVNDIEGNSKISSSFTQLDESHQADSVAPPVEKFNENKSSVNLVGDSTVPQSIDEIGGLKTDTITSTGVPGNEKAALSVFELETQIIPTHGSKDVATNDSSICEADSSDVSGDSKPILASANEEVPNIYLVDTVPMPINVEDTVKRNIFGSETQPSEADESIYDLVTQPFFAPEASQNPDLYENEPVKTTGSNSPNMAVNDNVEDEISFADLPTQTALGSNNQASVRIDTCLESRTARNDEVMYPGDTSISDMLTQAAPISLPAPAALGSDDIVNKEVAGRIEANLTGTIDNCEVSISDMATQPFSSGVVENIPTHQFSLTVAVESDEILCPGNSSISDMLTQAASISPKPGEERRPTDDANDGDFSIADMATQAFPSFENNRKANVVVSHDESISDLPTQPARVGTLVDEQRGSSVSEVITSEAETQQTIANKDGKMEPISELDSEDIYNAMTQLPVGNNQIVLDDYSTQQLNSDLENCELESVSEAQKKEIRSCESLVEKDTAKETITFKTPMKLKPIGSTENNKPFEKGVVGQSDDASPCEDLYSMDTQPMVCNVAPEDVSSYVKPLGDEVKHVNINNMCSNATKGSLSDVNKTDLATHEAKHQSSSAMDSIEQDLSIYDVDTAPLYVSDASKVVIVKEDEDNATAPKTFADKSVKNSPSENELTIEKSNTTLLDEHTSVVSNVPEPSFLCTQDVDPNSIEGRIRALSDKNVNSRATQEVIVSTTSKKSTVAELLETLEGTQSPTRKSQWNEKLVDYSAIKSSQSPLIRLQKKAKTLEFSDTDEDTDSPLIVPKKIRKPLKDTDDEDESIKCKQVEETSEPTSKLIFNGKDHLNKNSKSNSDEIDDVPLDVAESPEGTAVNENHVTSSKGPSNSKDVSSTDPVPNSASGVESENTASLKVKDHSKGEKVDINDPNSDGVSLKSPIPEKTRDEAATSLSLAIDTDMVEDITGNENNRSVVNDAEESGSLLLQVSEDTSASIKTPSDNLQGTPEKKSASEKKSPRREKKIVQPETPDIPVDFFSSPIFPERPVLVRQYVNKKKLSLNSSSLLRGPNASSTPKSEFDSHSAIDTEETLLPPKASPSQNIDKSSTSRRTSNRLNDTPKNVKKFRKASPKKRQPSDPVEGHSQNSDLFNSQGSSDSQDLGRGKRRRQKKNFFGFEGQEDLADSNLKGFKKSDGDSEACQSEEPSDHPTTLETNLKSEKQSVDKRERPRKQAFSVNDSEDVEDTVSRISYEAAVGTEHNVETENSTPQSSLKKKVKLSRKVSQLIKNTTEGTCTNSNAMDNITNLRPDIPMNDDERGARFKRASPRKPSLPNMGENESNVTNESSVESVSVGDSSNNSRSSKRKVSPTKLENEKEESVPKVRKTSLRLDAIDSKAFINDVPSTKSTPMPSGRSTRGRKTPSKEPSSEKQFDTVGQSSTSLPGQRVLKKRGNAAEKNLMYSEDSPEKAPDVKRELSTSPHKPGSMLQNMSLKLTAALKGEGQLLHPDGQTKPSDTESQTTIQVSEFTGRRGRRQRQSNNRDVEILSGNEGSSIASTSKRSVARGVKSRGKTVRDDESASETPEQSKEDVQTARRNSGSQNMERLEIAVGSQDEDDCQVTKTKSLVKRGRRKLVKTVEDSSQDLTEASVSQESLTVRQTKGRRRLAVLNDGTTKPPKETDEKLTAPVKLPDSQNVPSTSSSKPTVSVRGRRGKMTGDSENSSAMETDQDSQSQGRRSGRARKKKESFDEIMARKESELKLKKMLSSSQSLDQSSPASTSSTIDDIAAPPRKRGRPKALTSIGATSLNKNEESAFSLPASIPSSPAGSNSSRRKTPRPGAASSSRIAESSTLNEDNTSSSVPDQKVMFTGLSDVKLSSMVKKLGGKVTEKPKDCTVLVTDKVRRTVKFLCALGLGKPIVSPNWLSKSLAFNQFTDPNASLLMDEESEVKLEFNLSESLQTARNSRLLEGYSFYVSASVVPPRAEIKSIVECSGGTYLAKPPSKWTSNAIIISSQKDKLEWAKLTKHGVLPPILSAEAILSGVLQQKFDLRKHRLK